MKYTVTAHKERIARSRGVKPFSLEDNASLSGNLDALRAALDHKLKRWISIHAKPDIVIRPIPGGTAFHASVHDKANNCIAQLHIQEETK